MVSSSSSTEVEVAVTNTTHSKSPTSVTFSSILPVPRHSRAQSTTSRKRAKPPSYELTSDDTLEFVRQRAKPQKTKKPKKADSRVETKTTKNSRASATASKTKTKTAKNSRASASASNDDNTPCTFCRVQYGSAQDPLKHEIWIACNTCRKWYHSTCAENNGVMEDDGTFLCSSCLD